MHASEFDMFVQVGSGVVEILVCIESGVLSVFVAA